MSKKEQLEKYLETRRFQINLRLANNFEQYSGAGLWKKIARILFASRIYIPYILMVKFGLFKKTSIQARLFWGREIKIPLNDYDSLALKTYGFAGGTQSELKLAKFFIQNLESQDIFYDIGANYGFFTYLAEELCREVHAFEPNPNLAQIVRNNTNKNSRVSVNEIALSDTDGETELHMSESTGLSTINTSTIDTHTYSFNSKIKVRTSTLDSYSKEKNIPAFIKIDVEGAEENVIRGGERLLSHNAPIIAMEVWGKNNGWETSRKAIELLRNFNYEPFYIESDGNIRKAPDNLSSIIPPQGGDNFIFKKR